MTIANLHTLADSETDPNSEFKQKRFAILSLLEGKVPTPYFDSKGIITIGIGFNIDSVPENRNNVMEAMDLSDTQQDSIRAAWVSARMTEIKAMPQATKAQRDSKDAELRAYLNGILGVGQTFTMTDPQIKTVFDELVMVHQGAISSLIGTPSIEQIVLTSLHYNVPTLIGKGLKAALALTDPHEARTEAWYQIRYAHDDQLHKRRYEEAALFRLYDDPSAAPSKEESLAVYRMFTQHRLETNHSAADMIAYDQEYANDSTYGIPAANADLTAAGFGTYVVKTLSDELTPAANVLMQEYIPYDYSVGRKINPLNIQVANDASPILIGESFTGRTGSNKDLLIGRDGLGMFGADYLYGGAGDDILIGRSGNDYLDGGEGDDTMEGGEGIDTYVITDNDRIIDTGRNNIIWDGKLIAGEFKEIKNNPGTYTFISDDNNYYLAFHSPGKLTLSAEDSITFINQTSAAAFGGHDFGITLRENPDLAHDWTFTATALNYEAYAMKGGTQNGKRWYWYAYGDANKGDTKTFFEDAIPSLSISGNSGNDYLYGLNRADTITGGSGNDIVSGEWGYAENGTYYNIPGPSESDQLDGGSGNDLILGSRAADILYGGADNDFLSGLDGEDVVRGDAGNDAVTGGSHNDILSGGAGDDILFGDGYLVFSGATVDDLPAFGVQYTFAANGYPTGYTTNRFSIATDAEVSGDDILSGGAGRDWLDGGFGADMLDGGTENDSLFGGEGDDWLFGGDGNDWLVGDNGDLSGSGNDTLNGGAGNDLLYGLSGNDTLLGDAGADELHGFAGDDILSGGSEADYLSGGDSNDILNGGSESDTLFGELGDDQLEGGTGNDYLDGGDGRDGYFFSLGDGNDYVNDAVGMSRITLTDVISLESVSFSWAKKVGNVITADPDGNDLLIQYSVSDSVTIANGRLNTNYELWLNGEQITLSVIQELAGQQITGTDGDDELTGGRGADTLIAGAGNDRLFGQAGNDNLSSGTGDDVLDGGEGADKLDGGDGIDTVSYVNSTAGISVSLSTGRGYSGYALGDTLIACENLTGSAYDDILTGNSTNNVLIGNSGNDRLTGGTGTDSLYGGSGNDVLEGNAGEDVLFGGAGDDEYLVYRSDGIDYFNDQEGSNTITFKYAVPFSNITVNPVTYSDGMVIDDKQGQSIQVRYSTNDSLIIANGRSSNLGFTYNFGSGPILTHAQLLYYLSEEIIGTDGDDMINAQGGDDTVYGGNGNDTIDGGEGTKSLYGGDGDDTFIMGNGNSYVDGGSGFDTIDYSKAPEWPRLIVDLETGVTQKSSSYSDTYVSIENVIGSPYNDTIFGDSSNNSLNGNAGDDILIGKAGDDCLIGGDGNDILDGGLGADVLDGGNGLDKMNYSSSSQGIIVNLVDGAGSGGDAEGDTYLSIENIEGTLFDDIIIGDDGNNEIIGRSGGTPTNGDQIYGGKGDDRILANGQLYGGEGNDYIEVNYDFNSSEASSLFGGLGDDVLVGDLRYGGYGWFPHVPDAITMDGGEGNDFLYTEQPAIMFGGDGTDTLLNHTYKIGARMEGGNGDDILIAQESRNGGRDILKGGVGNDVLEGGYDNDTYQFSAGDGFDILADIYWDSDDNDNLSKREFVHFEDIESIAKISVNFASFNEEKKWEGRLPFFSNGDPVDYYSVFTNDSSQVVEDADGEELLIRYGNGDSIVIVNGRTNLNYSFSFANGNEHSHAELLALAMAQQNHAPELLSAVQDQYISSGEVFSYTLPAETFVDPDTGDTLSFSATLADGNALPSWLNFDAVTRTFSGTPASPGLTSVRITATDAGNLSTSDVFDIVIKSQGLQLTGTANADNLFGKDGDDTLNGLEGNDRLYGYNGIDILIGGLGNDTLRGGLSADILDGGDGLDTADYRDSLAALTVNLTSGAAAGGTAEGDTLVSIENIYGSEYADTLTGSVGKNTLIGYDGDDVLHGLEGNDSLRGEAGADQLFGGLGNDTLRGGLSADILDGGDGLDTADYRDSLAALTVNLTSGAAAGGTAAGDTLISIENIYGSEYADTLTGSVGKNTLIGYGGDDVLHGLEGNDSLRGEAGTDQLFGGLGNDSLTGGAGNDLFVFDTALNARTNKDLITDFAAGLDKLQLDKSIFTSLIEKGTLSSSFFNSSATGVAGDADDYFLYNASSGALLYDADGNGQGVAVQFATLTTKPMITANDFLVTA